MWTIIIVFLACVIGVVSVIHGIENDSSKIVYFGLGLFVVALVYGISVDVIHRYRDRVACKEVNGIVMETRNNDRFCVKKDAIIYEIE